MKWVVLKVIERESGLTEYAIRGKRKTGVWVEGTHWRKGPDGRLYFNREAIEKWVEGEVA